MGLKQPVVRLTTHLHLVPRLRIIGTIALQFVCAFVVRTGTVYYFLIKFICSNKNILCLWNNSNGIKVVIILFRSCTFRPPIIYSLHTGTLGLRSYY